MKKKNLLIVDDDLSLLETLTDIFTDDGYNVEGASSGEEAIRLMMDDGLDVILMDIKMSGMSGVEAFKKMRKSGINTPVIMMTGFSDEEVMVGEAIDEGAYAVLIKPFDVGGLIDRVREVVQDND
ncbi:MAG: response regulator [Deltaproteobacteria bacterium]|jgi:DNA-binding response OmpR family regulator|nr:response regulator [Deltaproteobacteria bacterium]